MNRRILILVFLALLLCIPNAFALPSDCSKLGRYECRHSERCTLNCETLPSRPGTCHGDYKCEPKTDSCEIGLSQDSLTKESCQSRKGCEYKPAICYCGCEEADEPAAKAAHVPMCNCACGHGPAAHCVTK